MNLNREGARRARPTRIMVAAAVSTCALVVGSCSTLPHNTTTQVLRSFEGHAEDEPVIAPDDSRAPDLLLRDFFSASAIPSGDYRAARSFLASGAADSWNPQGNVLVLDTIDLITSASDPNRQTFQVRGKLVGAIGSGGAYEPKNANYEAEFTMTRNDGAWRITDLPAEVVIDRTELRNRYQPQSLYFYERTGSALVADRRWLFNVRESLDSELVTLLMQGASSNLEPATAAALPPTASFVGKEDGVYRFNGMSELDQDERRKFAAQLVWTLNNAGFTGAIKAQADGAPLVEGMPEMTIDDFSEFNPREPASTVSDLYALNDGDLLDVTADSVEPVDGPLGSSGDVQSADVAHDGQVAAVRKAGGNRSRLYVGDLDGTVAGSVTAKTLSRPTFELDGEAAWTVVDGKRVVRVKPAANGEKIAETEVDTSALDKIDGEISVLRLSSTGARAAMIIKGSVYTGVVSRSQEGEYRIVNVREIYPEVGDSALSLDWQDDDSLVVGTASTQSPVWRIEQDGSASTSMPSGNVSAPVVALEVSPSTIYLTDSHAMLQMPTVDSESSFWREVRGLQGMRSSPIIAN